MKGPERTRKMGKKKNLGEFQPGIIPHFDSTVDIQKGGGPLKKTKGEDGGKEKEKGRKKKMRLYPK